jgi:ubiquitin-protein ligase E3 C
VRGLPFFHHCSGLRESPDLYGNRADIDGGGGFEEFVTSFCKEVFDTDRGLRLANEKNELYPNPHAYATERESSIVFVRPVLITRCLGGVAHSLDWYLFIGRILAKAMYEGIVVDVAFARFFLAEVRIIIRCICALGQAVDTLTF